MGLLNFPINVLRKSVREGGQLDIILQRFGNNRLGMLGLILTLLYLTVAIFGPMVAPYGPGELDTRNRLEGPSEAHLFGTDNYGRDILSRTIIGARYSLQVAVVVVTFSSIVGITLDLLAGFYRS
jgi:peptide/nickel transport system permease protein